MKDSRILFIAKGISEFEATAAYVMAGCEGCMLSVMADYEPETGYRVKAILRNADDEKFRRIKTGFEVMRLYVPLDVKNEFLNLPHAQKRVFVKAFFEGWNASTVAHEQ